jgi:hypothetical protein
MFRFLKGVAAKINRMVGLSVQQTYLYRISEREGWSASAANDKSLTWEMSSPEQVGQLFEIGPFDRSDGLQRLRRGDLCYTVHVDGRLAHYSWVQRSGAHPITEAAATVPVESGEFWIYNCRTVDWARGKRIYPATLEHIIHDHFAQGYGTAWIYTTRENIASQKGILRARFAHVATLSAFRVGRRYFRLGRSD